MRIFYALLFIFTDGPLYAMLTQKPKEEIELIPCQKVKKLQVKKSCGKGATRCLPVTCGLAVTVFLVTALYAATHPAQECWESNGPYLNLSDTTDIGDNSFDVSIKNCGICVQEVMRCNYPIEGVRTPKQLMSHVTEHMAPICDPGSVYQVKVNVIPERDWFASLRMPGDQENAFRAFDDQKQTTATACKVRRPFSRSKFKKRAR